ncbi:MAG: undecaprenyldiphospho-muramoylpentapeptide beta-N-acetylglucosaminyltransferase [Lachnospirales bacterium]
MKTIILTGGGTAGHVTPNIALLPYLKEAGYDVKYIGSINGMEKQLIEDCGVEYYGIESGKLRRYIDAKNISDIFRVVKGVHQARKLIKKLKPDIVFSKGGFVAVPVVVGAYLNKVPVILHESDITPGLANKLAIPFAKAVCTTFPEAVKAIPDNKGMLTGTPIRDMIFEGNKEKGLNLCGFKGDKPVMLVMGGSQGSVKINNFIRELLPKLMERFDVIHLCGKGNFDKTRAELNGYKQFEYVSDELPDIFAATDFVVSRAGSNAICEFLALNMPMLLIPLSKKASRGDQILNAESFEKQGFAKVYDEDTMTSKGLFEAITTLYDEKDKYIENMKKADVSKGTKAVMEIILSASK